LGRFGQACECGSPPPCEPVVIGVRRGVRRLRASNDRTLRLVQDPATGGAHPQAIVDGGIVAGEEEAVEAARTAKQSLTGCEQIGRDVMHVAYEPVQGCVRIDRPTTEARPATVRE